MLPILENYLRVYAQIDSDDIARIMALAVPRSLQRNELLLQEGQVCRNKVFVLSGLLRIFGVSATGAEHILYFSPENSWTVDAESYDRQAPSKLNISAIEPSEVLLWSKPDFSHLQAEIPKLKQFSQQLISNSNHMGRQRLLTTLSATPEEKYEDFIRNYPGLLQRLPLRMIAAYLGISLKTLTRIRHTQLHS